MDHYNSEIMTELYGTSDPTTDLYIPYRKPYPHDASNKYEAKLNYIEEHNAPIPQAAVDSHNQWVTHRKPWSGNNRIKQAPIEAQPPSGWVGIRLPEPAPVNPLRARQLTEYGPADFEHFVTETRKRGGQPVYLPADMLGFTQTGSRDGYIYFGQ